MKKMILPLLFGVALVGLMSFYLADSEVFENNQTSSPNNTDESKNYLRTTKLINFNHPKVKAKALALTKDAVDEREKALRIYRFVRDEIKFSFTGDFYRTPASDVLEKKRGYCNTKATLFIALLRASEIPARQYFVDISQDILFGFVDTGNAYVDHSYTEVWLEGRWLKVDSYTVDAGLYQRAVEKLKTEKRKIGYGVHIDGINDWDGKNDSFVQFVDNQNIADLKTLDHRIFADNRAFYASDVRHWNKQNALVRFAFGFFISSANQKIEKLRSQ